MQSIILTRPMVQSHRFEAEISDIVASRAAVVISPLIEIAFLEFSEPADTTDVVFTSENGVAGFAALAHAGNRRAFCVGDRTALAAQKAGFAALSAGGDVQDLVELIAKEGAGRVTYARGAHVSLDLTRALGAVGIPVDEVIVYSQEPIALNDEAKTLIRGSEKLIFPLFSARSMRLLTQQDIWGERSNLSAICLSKTVAEAAPAGVFETIEICDQPNSAAMVAKLRGLIA